MDLQTLLAEFVAIDGNAMDASRAMAAFKALQEKAAGMLVAQPPAAPPAAVHTPALSVTPPVSDSTNASVDSHMFGSPWAMDAFTPVVAKPPASVNMGVLIAEPLCARHPSGGLVPLEPVDWKSERKVILKALADSNRAVKVRFDVGTTDALRVRWRPVFPACLLSGCGAVCVWVQTLLDFGCEVLHFSGHGGIDPNDYILLENDQVRFSFLWEEKSECTCSLCAALCLRFGGLADIVHAS